MKRIFIIFGIITVICCGAFAQQSNLVSFQLPLDGRLISGLDPSKLINTTGETPQISNFATLTNMEYTDNGIRSVRGMSVITTTPLTTFPKINTLFQFVKANPVETHVLMQSYNSGETQSKVFRLSTATPNTGLITTTALHTDATGAGDGRFSDAPIGHTVYCNGAETQVWGGIETQPGYFAIFDGSDPAVTTLWSKDYTDQVLNNLTDVENVATLRRVDVTQFDVGVGSVTAYIAARLPLQGARFYVGTANTRTGVASVDYWNGSTLTAVTSLVDNTSSGGITLAQTGTIAFDSTEATAKVRIIDGVYGYFYRFTFADATDTATLSQVTVDEPFQPMVDFWDGQPRTILSLQTGTGTVFTDGTTNVFKDEFSYDDSTLFDEATYLSVDNKGGSGSAITMGFNERLMGVEIKFIPDKINTVASVLTVKYWDGVAFQAVSDLRDGTSAESTTFKQTGLVTWTPLAENVEFRRTVGGKKTPLFYYQFTTNNTMQGASNKLFVYHVSGIPSQKRISNYKFSLNAQGRVWLFNDQSGDKNQSIVSSVSTLNVFNGEDSGDPLFYGDDEGVQAATTVHVRTTAGSRDNILVLKNNASHLLVGEDPTEWDVITISDLVGCNAPLTLAGSSIGLEFAPLQSKQVAMWQGAGGIYLWDGTSIIPISDSISNYFDQSKSEAISLTKAHLSRGFFEVHDSNHYYHWMFSSKATSTNDMDTELVFDLKRQGWFEINRETKPLQAATNIVATDTGSTYAYGGINTGEIMRLDNGTSWDGLSITSVFETGDIPLAGNIMTETKLRYLRLITGAKTTTTNSVRVTHFIDGKNTGESFNMSPARSGFRLAMPIVSRNQYGTFHRFRATMTTNDEVIGFSPMALGGWFQPWREVHQ